MTDRYMKIVLTIIAVAMSVIAARDLVGPSRAAYDCGAIRTMPCYIAVVDFTCGYLPCTMNLSR